MLAKLRGLNKNEHEKESYKFKIYHEPFFKVHMDFVIVNFNIVIENL